MLRRILILLLVLLVTVGSVSAYEEITLIKNAYTGEVEGDPGEGDTSPRKADDQYFVCMVVIGRIPCGLIITYDHSDSSHANTWQPRANRSDRSYERLCK